MEKPPPGHGHLLEVKDPAQPVGVGDEVGECVQVAQVSGHKAAEKGGAAVVSRFLPQAAAQLINGHRDPPGGK